jgi:hypothetical protein
MEGSVGLKVGSEGRMEENEDQKDGHDHHYRHHHC